MAAGAWIIHDKAKLYIGAGAGGIDLDADVFKIGLALSTSNVGTTSIDGYATLTNEHAGVNGYATGGEIITGITWTESAGVITFDGADTIWTAAGGSIVARYAFIYDDTVTLPVAKPILAHCLLDATPADVTITSGNTLTVQQSVSGIFTVN